MCNKCSTSKDECPCKINKGKEGNFSLPYWVFDRSETKTRKYKTSKEKKYQELVMMLKALAFFQLPWSKEHNSDNVSDDRWLASVLPHSPQWWKHDLPPPPTCGQSIAVVQRSHWSTVHYDKFFFKEVTFVLSEKGSDSRTICSLFTSMAFWVCDVFVVISFAHFSKHSTVLMQYRAFYMGTRCLGI